VADKGVIYCYKIPNVNDNTWIETKPKVHISNMSNVNQEKRNMIKMVKEWNRKHSSYLSSHHIEIMALSYGSVSNDYAWHIHMFFEHMAEKIKYKTPSPSGLGGNVDDYLSYSDRQEAKQRLDIAVGKSLTAWFDTYNNNDKESIEEFCRIFGGRFPSYG
jgi:hypothetical protein